MRSWSAVRRGPVRVWRVIKTISLGRDCHIVHKPMSSLGLTLPGSYTDTYSHCSWRPASKKLVQTYYLWALPIKASNRKKSAPYAFDASEKMAKDGKSLGSWVAIWRKGCIKWKKLFPIFTTRYFGDLFICDMAVAQSNPVSIWNVKRDHFGGLV